MGAPPSLTLTLSVYVCICEENGFCLALHFTASRQPKEASKESADRPFPYNVTCLEWNWRHTLTHTLPVIIWSIFIIYLLNGMFEYQSRVLPGTEITICSLKSTINLLWIRCHLEFAWCCVRNCCDRFCYCWFWIFAWCHIWQPTRNSVLFIIRCIVLVVHRFWHRN